MRGWLLPLLLLLPAAGALTLLLAPQRWGSGWARPFGVGVSGATLLLAGVAAAARGDAGVAGRAGADGSATQAAWTDVAWIGALDLRFTLGLDGISAPLVVLTAALVFLCLVYTLRVVPRAGRHRALVGLVLLVEVGMLGTFLALDLLLFFVFFETVLIPMWFLITVWGEDAKPAPGVGGIVPARRAPETARGAATTFLLYTLLGSALMLVGFLVVHSYAGTFDIRALTAAGGAGIPRNAQLGAFGLIALGLAVKIPVWPLHTWLPAAHTAAPTIGSVLLAGVLLKMGSYGLVRVALPVLPEGARAFAPYLAALGTAGILYGSLACLAQRDLKRLIAYSSVGHMGFVVLGIATLTPVGVNGALLANLAHGLITGLLFFLVGAIKDRHGTTDLETLPRGLYARLPRLGVLLSFAAVASLGLPGLAGFWGEALAMFGAYSPAPGLDAGFYRVLMVGAGIGTVLTAAYLLAVVRRVAQGEADEAASEGKVDRSRGDATRHELIVWAPLVAAILVLGVWPGLALSAFDGEVRQLLDLVGGAAPASVPVEPGLGGITP